MQDFKFVLYVFEINVFPKPALINCQILENTKLHHQQEGEPYQ